MDKIKNDAFEKWKEEYSKHLDLNEPELLLLKGHLILEQLINELLSLSFRSEKDFDKLRLSFDKKLTLLEGLDGLIVTDQIIPQLRELNSIRNKLAHSLEFDRYTQLQFLSRNLAESLHDLMMIQTGMDNFAGDVEMLLHEQSRLNTDLQEGLTQTRMVAFSTLMPRLRQLARKTSRELDKQINLELLGGEVELDRNVIDQLIDWLIFNFYFLVNFSFIYFFSYWLQLFFKFY